MWALRIAIYSVLIGILLFFTTAILPETDIFNSMGNNFSKWLFVIPIGLFFGLYKEKWWIKVVSLLLSVIVSIVLVVLFIP